MVLSCSQQYSYIFLSYQKIPQNIPHSPKNTRPLAVPLYTSRERGKPHEPDADRTRHQYHSSSISNPTAILRLPVFRFCLQNIRFFSALDRANVKMMLQNYSYITEKSKLKRMTTLYKKNNIIRWSTLRNVCF